MNRVAEWEKRLVEVAERYGLEPWTWGETDCAHFMGACVEAICGADILGTYKNSYSSRLGYWARLRHRGDRTPENALAAACERLGFAEGIPECSMAGDVGITAIGAMCVRFPCGFLARAEDGKFHKVRAVRSWCVAWPGVS